MPETMNATAVAGDLLDKPLSVKGPSRCRLEHLKRTMRSSWPLAAVILTMPFAWGCPTICYSVGTGIGGGGPIRGLSTASIPIAPNSGTGVLTRFALSTTGGDHHVNDIGILRNSTATAITGFFADRSPTDDEWVFSARYCKLPEDLLATATFSTTTTTCASTACDVVIPGLSATTSFLLVGFRMTLPAGVDQDLGALVVMPRDSGNFVLVAFNGPETLGRGFTVTLQYALVPSDRLLEIVAGDEERVTSTNSDSVHRLSFSDSLAGASEARYLAGFSFARVGLNQNVHLEQVRVDLNAGFATFQDDDAGEFVRWRIKYYVPR